MKSNKNPVVLYIVNYQREIPPFLINEIKNASPIFESIIYISPKLKQDNRGNAQFGKTKYIIGKKFTELISFICLPFLLLSKMSRNNIKNAKMHKQFSFHFLKEQAIYLYEKRTLSHLLKKAYKKFGPGIILSSWFNACALTTGDFCRKNIDCLSFSFAHAYEVQSSVSPYVGYMFDKYKLTYNKHIYFISEKVKEQYVNDIIQRKVEFDTNKISVRHLGTFDFGYFGNYKNNNKKIIVTCSSAVEVKRIDIFIEALALCDSNIHWIHIGDGPLLNSLQVKANDLLAKKNNVSFEFKGKMDNESIMQFYANNQIDLFVNVSKSEGVPVSIMEAMSFGIPVIATNVGGTSELVNDSLGCLLDSNPDCKTISQSLDSFLSLEDKKICLFRKNARKQWEKYFDINREGNKQYFEMIDLYSKIKQR